MIKFKTVTNNLDPDKTFVSYIESKLQKLEVLLKDANSTANIELSKTKKEYTLSIVLVVDDLRPGIKQQRFIAISNDKSEYEDAYACANDTIKKLSIQISKVLDKYKTNV